MPDCHFGTITMTQLRYHNIINQNRNSERLKNVYCTSFYSHNRLCPPTVSNTPISIPHAPTATYTS